MRLWTVEAVGIGLRKKTPFGPIICQKIERLRKKRLFAGKRETAALEADLFVITRRTGNKKPMQRTCKGIGVAGSFFSRCVEAVVGWAKRIIRMGGELYHGEVCDVHEMFAISVFSI